MPDNRPPREIVLPVSPETVTPCDYGSSVFDNEPR